MKTAKAAIYRHFDSDGDLLYVGRAACPFTRNAAHRSTADWYNSVVRIDIEWVDAPAAPRIEWEAIQAEKPKHNKAGKEPARAIAFRSKAEKNRVRKVYFSHGCGQAVRIVASQILGFNVRMADLVATFGKR